MNEEQIKQSAENVLKAYPAARNAISGALARLNAPWYVRAWHQWKGDQGWGLGEELHMVYAGVAVLVLLGGLWLIR